MSEFGRRERKDNKKEEEAFERFVDELIEGFVEKGEEIEGDQDFSEREVGYRLM